MDSKHRKTGSEVEDRSSYMKRYYQRNREIILHVARKRYRRKAEQKWKLQTA